MAWGFSNTGGSGGLKSSDALLRVIAMAGSTVTISKGSIIKTDQGHVNALDPSLYDYYFVIHQSQFDSVNPWTVTARKDNDVVHGSIIIDTADEYDLELRYSISLIEGNIIKTEFEGSQVGGTFTITSVTDSVRFTTNSPDYVGLGRTVNPIDLTNYSKIRVFLTYYYTWGSAPAVAALCVGRNPPVADGTSHYSNLDYTVMISGNGVAQSGSNITKILDVSSLTGLYYIALTVSGSNANAGVLYVAELVCLQ